MMLLVDTSVWVDYFQAPDSAQAQKFDAALGKDEIVIGDLIVVEILQGLREGRQLQLVEATMAAFRIEPLCGPEIARKAAANYRTLRKKGLAVRGTIDVIIATWCIENRVPLLHNDGDFDVMRRALDLPVWQ